MTLFSPLDKRNTRDKAKGLRITSERYIGELGYPIRSHPWDLPRSGSFAVARLSTAEGRGEDYVIAVFHKRLRGLFFFFFFYKVATFRDHFH